MNTQQPTCEYCGGVDDLAHRSIHKRCTDDGTGPACSKCIERIEATNTVARAVRAAAPPMPETCDTCARRGWYVTPTPDATIRRCVECARFGTDADAMDAVCACLEGHEDLILSAEDLDRGRVTRTERFATPEEIERARSKYARDHGDARVMIPEDARKLDTDDGGGAWIEARVFLVSEPEDDDEDHAPARCRSCGSTTCPDWCGGE